MEQNDREINNDLEVCEVYDFFSENYLEDERGVKFLANMAKCAHEFLFFFDETKNNKIFDEKIFPHELKKIASDHLKEYEKRFELPIDMVCEEFFSLFRMMQRLLNIKFDNHDLCDAIDLRPNSNEIIWLCHSMPCKNKEYKTFKLLDY